MTNESIYVVSQREGADSYDSATVFTGDNAEADAKEQAAALAVSNPGAKHHVVTADDFASGFDNETKEGE